MFIYIYVYLSNMYVNGCAMPGWALSSSSKPFTPDVNVDAYRHLYVGNMHAIHKRHLTKNQM